MNSFVELCAGSAAVSFRILYDSSPVVSYAGSKSGYASSIIKVFEMDISTITSVMLVDPGPWGNTLRIIDDEKMRKEAVQDILLTIEKDPREVWRNCKDNTDNAANHLMLIASTYGGAETGGFKGFHKSRPNVDGFIPSRQTIARRISKLTKRDGISITIHQESATDIEPFPCYCYIDPPYRNCKTKYRNTFTRDEVVQTARTWSRVGAKVIVSENEPIVELIKRGWSSIDITDMRHGQCRKNSTSTREWLTYNF